MAATEGHWRRVWGARASRSTDTHHTQSPTQCSQVKWYVYSRRLLSLQRHVALSLSGYRNCHQLMNLMKSKPAPHTP